MSKQNPSKEYLENINYYKKMHLEGYDLIDGRKRRAIDAYNGKSTIAYAQLIKKIIKKNHIKNMLDYGSGKGFFYDNPFNENGVSEVLLDDGLCTTYCLRRTPLLPTLTSLLSVVDR